MDTNSEGGFKIVQIGDGSVVPVGQMPAPDYSAGPSVIQAGQFSRADLAAGRVGLVRLKSGTLQYFAGELLITALKNGGKLVDTPECKVSDLFRAVIEQSLSTRHTTHGAERTALPDYRG